MTALRAVGAEEKPVDPPPVEAAAPAAKRRAPTVSEAAESGDHRALLVAMRARIASAIQDPKCSPRDLAALTRRLQDIAAEIVALDARAEEEAGEHAGSPDETWDPEAL